MNQIKSKSQIIRGCWQLAQGHSQSQSDAEPVLDAIDHGFTTFDCADIYLGVEDLLGRAAKLRPNVNLRIHTKFVPDLDQLKTINPAYIENIIDRSLMRLEVDTIDLLQFHWWDLNIENYMQTMEILCSLKAKGKIAEIGLTNVNLKYLKRFAENFQIASVQTQVSLFDRRVERGIGKYCHQNNIAVLGYGCLLGGFISEKWLHQPEPKLDQLLNRSLIKYKLLIDEACGWAGFQKRLRYLNELAHKYKCDIANVAIAALIQCKYLDAAIIGLSPQHYGQQNANLCKKIILDQSDLENLYSWSCNLAGDAYDAERDTQSSHAKIMKYNLNDSNTS